MKTAPLNYYVNLVITEECIKFFDENNKNATTSSYFSFFSYIETYLRSNANLPSRLKELIWKLYKALGEIFGFNSDTAMKFIVKYFTSNDYNKYLDFVTLRDEYIKHKN